MQKKLIALAIAGLSSTTFAQSNVTISGQLKGGYEQYKVSNIIGSAAATVQNGKQNMLSDQTSSIVLKGEENLGNGLSAIFQIDNRFTIDTGNTNSSSAMSTTAGTGTTGTLGSGNTWVGIKSASFGEFKMGRTDLHYNESERIENGAKSLSQQAMVGRGILSQVDGNFVGPAATRTNNVFFWDSPNWSGITVRLAYSTNPYGQEGPTGGAASATDHGKASNAVVRYENGPLKTGVSHYRQSAEDGNAGANAGVAGSYNGADANQKSTRVWGGYTIAGFGFGLVYDHSSVFGGGDGQKKRDAWAIPLSYTMGNHGIYATYARAGDYKSTANGKVADSGAKQWTLGYDYNLSKRTSVGVNYTVLKNDRGVPGGVAADAEGDYCFSNLAGKGTTTCGLDGGGAKATQFYVGLRHAY